MKFTKNKLRVCHIPQVPGKSFAAEVKDEKQAYFTINLLANQHLWLYNNNYIPDYSNVLFVEVFEEGEWSNYWNDQESCEWDEVEAYFDKLKTENNG